MRIQSVCMGFTTSGECSVCHCSPAHFCSLAAGSQAPARPMCLLRSVCSFPPIHFCSLAAGSQAPARPMSLLQKAAQEAKQRAAASSAPFSALTSANASQNHGLRLPPTSQLGSHRGVTQGPSLASLGSMGSQATRRSNQGRSRCIHEASIVHVQDDMAECLVVYVNLTLSSATSRLGACGSSDRKGCMGWAALEEADSLLASWD